MTDLRVRPATRADAAELSALVNAAEEVDRTGEHCVVEDLLEALDNPLIDPARDWVVAEEAGRVVGHCHLRPRAPGEDVLHVGIEGTVRPSHRRRGLGSRLLPLMVARADDYVREHGAHLRPVVTGIAPSTNADLATLLERQRMRPERFSFLMEVDLHDGTTGSVPAVPEGYTLSDWQGIDHDEIREAHNAAFVDHYGFAPWSAPMWAHHVAGSRAHRPGLSLLLRDASGAVAAYVQTAEFEAVTAATGLREAFVGKVGTVEAHRRRGLASVLLDLALDRYRREGFDRSALDVDSENPTGALAIYERAGYRTAVRWTHFRLEDRVG